MQNIQYRPKNISSVVDEGHQDLPSVLAALQIESTTDNYPDWHASYSLDALLKVFILKELEGLRNETELARYLENHRNEIDFGLGDIPTQSTLWRTWNERFTEEHRQFVRDAADQIRDKLRAAGVSVPDDEFEAEDKDRESSERTRQRYVSQKTKEVTQHAKDLIYPNLRLDRADNAAVDESAFWDLQTYIGMRDSMAVNEGARSYQVDSTRDRTPLGHVHRHHLKKHSVPEFRAMYQRAVGELVSRARQQSQLDRGVTVAIDITAGNFWGDRSGHEDEILGSKSEDCKWGHQWASIQIVGDDVPIVLDVMPVKKGKPRDEIVAELLDNASRHVHIYRVLMDREFDSARVLDEVDDRGHLYLVPKRKRTSEKERIRELNRAGKEVGVEERELFNKGSRTYTEGNKLLYVPKENWDGELESGHENMVVFMTNMPEIEETGAKSHVERYRQRWGIENGYKKVKEFMALTTSKDFSLRYFYFAFACLLYNLWRLVDLLVKQTFGEDGSREPLVTANDFLTVAKKFIDPGG